MASPPPPAGRGSALFAGLGRRVVRHPVYVLVGWVVVLAVALPFLGRLGSVTQNSATSLPSSAPSAQAAAELDRMYPNQSFPTDSVILLEGANITGPTAQRATVALVAAVRNDTSLEDVGPVSSLYTAYAGYLKGMATIASSAIQLASSGSTPLLSGVNGSATVLWGPPSTFLAAWRALVSGHPGTSPQSWNYAAYRATSANLTGDPAGAAVLSAFYSGYRGDGAGFNGSYACATVPAPSVDSCADASTRLNVGPDLSSLFANASARGVAAASLSGLGVENWTDYPSIVGVGSALVANGSGLPSAWVRTVWLAFGATGPSAAGIAPLTTRIATTTPVAQYPLPIPPSIATRFVSPDQAATVVVVVYTVDSGTTTAAGHAPVYADVDELNRLVPRVLAANSPAGAIAYYQTGAAALDSTENADLSSTLAIVLPLTLLTLVAITIAYFRSPVTPLLTFGALGIAIVVAFGAVVLVGETVTHVDPTSITLVTTFILGVGTDYAIFLVARYREELVRGVPSHDAIVTSVTWAGQSIATSGAAALLATVALAFSGVPLLSQWGITLSLAIGGAVVIALTLIPAALTLLGPRVLWPYTGRRFERMAERIRSRQASEGTYFFRAGRMSQRRPRAIVGAVALVSIPVLYVALQVPLGFNFYDQLPGHQPATDGLAALSAHFGPGYVFPTTALVTLSAPLIGPSGPSVSGLSDLAALTGLAASTPGVRSVSSPVGPDGAPLATWANYSREPAGVQAQLLGVLGGFVGTDGRTVALTVTYTANGLSSAAVGTLDRLRSEFASYRTSHPNVAQVAFGGGAPLTEDIQQQMSLATERMLVAVSIGLVVVLLAVLRSLLIPVLAVATIGLSISWAWATTYAVATGAFGVPIFYFVPTVLFLLVLGLGIDYNIFVLTRVREERLRPGPKSEAVVRAIATTGGIITAAAIILASAFAILTTGSFLLLRTIGFAVAVAIVLDAMVVRTYLVPASLQLLGERMWSLAPWRRARASETPAGPPP